LSASLILFSILPFDFVRISLVIQLSAASVIIVDVETIVVNLCTCE